MKTTTKSSSGLLSSVLLAVQLLIAAAAVVAVYFRRVEIPHCDLECDFEMLDVTGNVFAALAVGAFITVAVLQVLLPGPAKWWLPSIGIVVTLIGALIANHLSDIALLMT